MTDKITAWLERWADIEGKASKGPWREDNYTVFPVGYDLEKTAAVAPWHRERPGDLHMDQVRADAAFLAFSRNNSRPAREAICLAVDALEWIMPKVHQGNHDGEFSECGKATCVEYRKALSAIAEIVGEKTDG